LEEIRSLHRDVRKMSAFSSRVREGSVIRAGDISLSNSKRRDHRLRREDRSLAAILEEEKRKKERDAPPAFWPPIRNMSKHLNELHVPKRIDKLERIVVSIVTEEGTSGIEDVGN